MFYRALPALSLFTVGQAWGTKQALPPTSK